MQVTTYRSVVVSLEEGEGGLVHVDVPVEGGLFDIRRSELRRAAIFAMKMRATWCLKQFIYHFLVDDQGQPDPGLNRDSLQVQFSSTAKLATSNCFSVLDYLNFNPELNHCR